MYYFMNFQQRVDNRFPYVTAGYIPFPILHKC